MKKIIALIALSVLTAQVLRSQEVNSDTLMYKYNEVVISASRMNMPLKTTPFSTSVVDSQVLNTLPRSLAIDEPLKLVPGVKVDNQANGERVHMSMRGQGILSEVGIRSIKVLLDGLPVNDPTGFAPDFFDVDMNTVEHIEVLRGPAASLYGGGAAGGIVNIITQNAPAVPVFADVSGIAGSNNFWKGFGQFGGSSNDVNYRASFSRTGGDGYRVHTHFWENNIYAKATYTPTPSIQLTPILSWNDTYHENPEGLSLAQYLQDPTQPNDAAVPYNEHMEMNRTTSGLTGLVQFLDNQEIRFNGYVKHSEYVEANNHVFDHQTITTPGASLQYTYKLGAPEDFIKNKFSLGADLQWQTIEEHQDSNNFSIELDSLWAKQQIRQWGTGVFLIDAIELGDDWNIMGSVRYDGIHNELNDQLNDTLSGSRDFSNVTGRLGLTYSPAREVALYGAWGQGFIPPSTDELDANPNGYGGFNSSLVPATSNSFEAGARGLFNRNLDYDVTGFYMTTSNDFDRYRVKNRGNGEEGTFYRNIGASKRYGAEIYASYAPVKQCAIQIAYTYSHFKYDIGAPIPILMDDTTIHKYIYNGHWLPNSPQHQLMVDVGYDVTPEVTLGVGSETLSKTYIDGANLDAEAASGYTLLNARIGYRWHVEGMSGDLSLTMRNITNQTYVAFTEPDTGGNSYQPGSDREIFLGLKIGLRGK